MTEVAKISPRTGIPQHRVAWTNNVRVDMGINQATAMTRHIESIRVTSVPPKLKLVGRSVQGQAMAWLAAENLVPGTDCRNGPPHDLEKAQQDALCRMEGFRAKP